MTRESPRFGPAYPGDDPFAGYRSPYQSHTHSATFPIESCRPHAFAVNFPTGARRGYPSLQSEPFAYVHSPSGPSPKK